VSPVLRCLVLSTALGLLTAAPAEAADWLSLQGLEPADPVRGAIRGFGFLQLSVEGYPGAEIDNPDLGKFDGQTPVFNTIEGSAAWGATIRRARVGLRGHLPGTGESASIQVSAELGQNPLTTVGGVWVPRLMDASVTLRSAGDVHLRMGRMKAPLSDESLEAVHVTAASNRFTRVTGQLLMERDASKGSLSGPVDGFRNLGVQAFGAHRAAQTEISWALMAGTTGTAVGRVAVEPTVNGRVQVARLLADGSPRSPVREEAAAFAFASFGERDIGDDDRATRLRAGGGAQLKWLWLRLRTEFVYAHGIVPSGVSPPFSGGTRTMAVDGSAWGATALAGARFAGRWEAGVVYSHLDRLPNGGEAHRLFDDLVGYVKFFAMNKVRFDFNAGPRISRAPEASETKQALLAETAPYTGLMITAIW